MHPVLDREEIPHPPPDLAGLNVLVTGSRGSIGKGVVTRVRELGGNPIEFDIRDGLDVTDPAHCQATINQARPDVILHLAAHKYATSAETDPVSVTRLNIDGTHHLTAAAREAGVPRVVFASTCKAIEPETVYGASKLIGERIALNNGYTVGRFFNVVESAGNVFEIWRDQREREVPMQITPCRRYFISLGEAVGFIVHLLDRPSARYAPFPGPPQMIADLAERLAPGYPKDHVPPRRGDRVVEPLVGHHESYRIEEGRLMIIDNPHDKENSTAETTSAEAEYPSP